MDQKRKYFPFFGSALLMCLVVFIIYPHYQYYIDPDGTAYLTIAKRYASGDFFNATNGYWSPWSCWLTAILIKTGFAAIPASVVINTLGAVGYLFITTSFFIYFNLDRKLQWSLNLALAVFLCFAVFWQSFDDLWECFFLLASLRMMLSSRFTNRPFLWVCTGLFGAFAYFSKAYAFPFFILNTVCCVYFLTGKDKVRWLKISFAVICTMLLISEPWIYTLHYKYGTWTTSTAGSLNMSWYLVGHPYYKNAVGTLVPAVYKDSPYFWEDPYLVNGVAPHFWTSWHLFGLQFLRIGLNMWKLLMSMLQLSVFFPVVAVLIILIPLKRTFNIGYPGKIILLVASFLVFPLGYVLINFEARYLWFMVPVAMVVGAIVLQKTHFGYKSVMVILFPLSFIVYPVFGLFKIYDEGKQEYDLATQLKAAHLNGTFTGNEHPQKMARIAYFSGLQYVYNTAYLRPDDSIATDACHANVDYYFRFYFRYEGDIYTKQYHHNIVAPGGRPLKELPGDQIENMTIYMLKTQ